jgi:hypothetical protein
LLIPFLLVETGIYENWVRIFRLFGCEGRVAESIGSLRRLEEGIRRFQIAGVFSVLSPAGTPPLVSL